MGLLHLLSYAGALAAFLFVTLSLASGLLWLAELIEEHSRYAKVIGMRAIYTIIALHVILIFTDSLPILPTFLSIIAHLTYLSNFSSSWPYISLTSPRFILSCILVVSDHFAWFFHFSAVAQEAKRVRGQRYRYGGGRLKDEGMPFMDVAAFFTICVWFVPLFLFLSLSANDNALPSFDRNASAPPSPPIGPAGSIDLSSTPSQPHSTHRQSRTRASTSLVRAVLAPLVSLLPLIRRRKTIDDEGIIAPRTPTRGSPIHSPVTMPPSYFPWRGNEDGGNISSDSRVPTPPYSSLTPETMARQRGASGSSRTPPPPRRVQSEAQVSSVNPRGIAVRCGTPMFNEPESMSGDGDANNDYHNSNRRPSRPSSAAGLSRSIANGSPGPGKMRLGVKTGELLTRSDAVVSEGPTKRKAD